MTNNCFEDTKCPGHGSPHAHTHTHTHTCDITLWGTSSGSSPLMFRQVGRHRGLLQLSKQRTSREFDTTMVSPANPALLINISVIIRAHDQNVYAHLP